MSNREKRYQIKKYFWKFPKWSLKLMGIGIMVTFVTELGLVLIFVGTLVIVYFAKKPSDEQFDEWNREYMDSAYSRSLIKTGLDKTDLVQDSVIIQSPRFWDIGGAATGIKKGKDKRVRYMPVGVTIIHFTQHQLVVYKCAIDLTTEKFINEEQYYTYYVDIVGTNISTKCYTIHKSQINAKLLSLYPKIENHIVDGKLQLSGTQIFELTSKGNASIKVVINDPAIIESAGGGEIPTRLAEKAVKAVQKKVLEVKMGQTTTT